MKADAKHLSASLARVLPILKGRTSLPILSCVKLEASGGKLALNTTSLDAFGCATCDCEGDLDPVCVDAMTLNYMVQHAGERVELLVKDKRLFVIGNGTAQLGLLDAVEFPAWPAHKTISMGVPTEDLAACVKGVAWATDLDAKMTVDAWRESVWVKCSPTQMQCCGTDGKEFAYVARPLICSAAEFLLPARQAGLLVDSLLTGATEVNLSDKFISTESDTFKVAIALAEGGYVPVESILKKERRSLGVLDVPALVESMQTIKALGGIDKWLDTTIEFEADVVRIIYRSANNFEREIPYVLQGEPFAIRIDAVRACLVFSHVHANATAFLDDTMIVFNDADYTYALALLK